MQAGRDARVPEPDVPLIAEQEALSSSLDQQHREFRIVRSRPDLPSSGLDPLQVQALQDEATSTSNSRYVQHVIMSIRGFETQLMLLVLWETKVLTVLSIRSLRSAIRVGETSIGLG